MSAPVVPTPEVERKVRVLVVPVPPICRGKVADVVKVGVARVGLVPNTSAPDPVSSVTAAAKFALLGVARNVATFAPRPDIPVLIGKPVQLARVPLDGVPSAPPLTTTAPAVPTFTPNAVATPVPSPAIPVLTGKPVQFVSVPLVGVPNTGVTKVGLVANTKAPEPVSSVREAARFADVGVAKNVATPTARPDTPVDIGSPVQLVNVPLVGVPRTGVTNVGLVAKTSAPDPVSSEITPAN